MSNENILGGLSDEQMMAWRMNHFARITQQHLANRAAADEEAVLRDAQDIENRAVMAKILEENRQKAVMDAYKMRELQNKNLEEDLRRQFLSANPAATENSWLLAKAEVKQNYFLERMKAEKNREEIEQEIYAGYKM
jgi:hypothetical protein